MATALLTAVSADRLLAWCEERAPRLSAASVVADGALELLGRRAGVEGGLLLIDHPDGLVAIQPSMETLAVRPLLVFWAAWLALVLAHDHRRAFAVAAVGLATTLIVGMIRYVVLVFAYLEHDEILTESAGRGALELFGAGWITTIFLIAAGLAVDRAAVIFQRGRAPGESSPAQRPWLALAATCLLGWAAGLGSVFIPPGPDRAGRILIDDRFCGVWEPTARRLDAEWYGDFATYSFTSLAEWLGKWFSVDVNTSREYTDVLLMNYDVLILKTPETRIPDPEVEAIERFVQRGGGLLLVGDHTNLLGMGAHLNALSARHGIRFLYDSVSEGKTGGFVVYEGARLGRGVGSLHVNRLEFMTSCSLELSGVAESVLVVEGCRREPHDYAGSSFFGRRGPYPDLRHGRTVLAATARVGHGRIAAFTDSTVWSSFAVFSHDREKLAMDLVRMLNRAPSRFEGLASATALAAALAATALAVWLAGRGLAAPALALGLSGFWLGVVAADALHRSTYALPAPNAPTPEAAFLWDGGACAFPPVLGSPESLPAERSFDTLLVSVQRLGLVPRVAHEYDSLLGPDTRVVFVVAPVRPPPERILGQLKSFVQAGGALVVVDDMGIGRDGSAGDFLRPFEITVEYHASGEGSSQTPPHVHLGGGMKPLAVPDPKTALASALRGRGRVVYLSDARSFSRRGLGHCFAHPWKAARERYEMIYVLLRDVLALAPLDRRSYGIL